MNSNTCLWYDPTCAISGLIDSLYELIVTIWNSILSGLSSLIESIPAPDFLLSTGTISVHSGVAWGADIFQLGFGLQVIVSAYTLRFILKRIPGIG